MKELTITISGETATGKSAVALYIQKQLCAIGIEATLTDDNGTGMVDEALGVIEDSMLPRLDALADKAQSGQVEVNVRTMHSRRVGAA